MSENLDWHSMLRGYLVTKSKKNNTYDYVKLYIAYFSNRVPVWEGIFTLENFKLHFNTLKNLHFQFNAKERQLDRTMERRTERRTVKRTNRQTEGQIQKQRLCA